MKAKREDTMGYNLKMDTALDVEVMWKRLVCHLFYVVVHVGAESEKKDQLKEEKNWTMPLGRLVICTSHVLEFACVYLHAKQYICRIGKAIKMVVPAKREIWYAKLGNAQLMNAPKVLEMYI